MNLTSNLTVEMNLTVEIGLGASAVAANGLANLTEPDAEPDKK